MNHVSYAMSGVPQKDQSHLQLAKNMTPSSRTDLSSPTIITASDYNNGCI